MEVYLDHRAGLIDYVTPIVGERSRAEDIVQEAFVRFVARPDSPAEKQAPQLIRPVSYLYRLVRNMAVDFLRRQQVEKRNEEEPAWWMLPSPSETPEQQIVYKQTLARMRAAMMEMDDEIRIAVEMKRFQNKNLQDIATELGVSVPTAHRRLRAGLMRLAQALDEIDG